MIDEERLEQHLNNGEPEYIMCAAIHIDDGKDYIFKPYNIDKGLVYCGWRHPNIFETIKEATVDQASRRANGIKEVQGFLTNKNRFLTRDEAYPIALQNHQIKNGKMIGSVLTSEDLW